MTNIQVRACCYAAIMIIIAIDWSTVASGLFLALMQFMEERPARRRGEI